jgi:tripeptidyl-peptidase-1
MLSFLNRGALSLAAVSLLTSCASAEVFERLAAVPEGMFIFRSKLKIS